MRSQRCTCVPGGKGTNVARAIKTLGHKSKALVLVGGHSGTYVVDMIRNQDAVDCVPVWVASQTRTITTILEEPIHRQTAFFEPGSRVTEDEARILVEAFTMVVLDAKVVTFNGTVCDPSINWLYHVLVAIAKKAGVCTILDAHGPEFMRGLESKPYMVKPNVAEAQELVGFSLDSMEAKWKAVDFFHEKGAELVVLSLGKDGALVSRDGERFHAIPPEIQEVNPVGSGDALVAGFAIGLQEQMSLREMTTLGIAAGAANAMSWDIGHFTREDVEILKDLVQFI